IKDSFASGLRRQWWLSPRTLAVPLLRHREELPQKLDRRRLPIFAEAKLQGSQTDDQRLRDQTDGSA
ncbi:MAG: hypothetical protein WA858_16805, partial [Xanthobacteraceae bacterium]